MVRRNVHSIKLEPKVWKTVKVVAAQRDVTIGELVEQAILEKLTRMGLAPPSESP